MRAFHKPKGPKFNNSPAVYVALIHKPGEFPLREHGVVEVEPSVLPDVGFPQTQGIDYPVELLISVVVLCGAESVGHTLNAVYDGAGEVVRGVYPIQQGSKTHLYKEVKFTAQVH